MAQQPDANKSRLLIVLLWGGMLLYFHFFLFPKFQKPPPQQAIALYAQAEALEKEGRTASSNISLADRVKKLNDAVGKYEEFYNANKDTAKTDPAVAKQVAQSRFQQVNIFTYLAHLEGKRSGTHWFDQAEMKLKEMEKAFHDRPGEVTVERLPQAGGTETVSAVEQGDLGDLASKRLNEIREDREVVRRPMWTWQILDKLVGLTGKQPGFSYFFALFIVVVVLKGLTWPFMKKQYAHQKDMLRVQPRIKAMQEEMKDRPPAEINQRMFQIYKEENVSIAGSCVPTLVSGFALLPVFYMVRDYEYQFTNATFMWIGSAASKASPWLADHLAQFDVPLFVVYNISMVGSMLLAPKPADPQQAQQQKMMLYMMPVVFGVMMWMYQWSSAFMLYWLVLNVVGIYQSWLLNKQFGLNAKPADASVTSTDGTVVKPPTPLAPMKGVHTKSPNGTNGQGKSTIPPNRVKPKGSNRRK